MRHRSDVRVYLADKSYLIMEPAFRDPERYEQQRKLWLELDDLDEFLGGHNLYCFKQYLANKIKRAEEGKIKDIYCDIFEYAFAKDEQYVEFDAEPTALEGI